MEKEMKMVIAIVIVAVLLLVIRAVSKPTDSEIILNVANKAQNNTTIANVQNVTTKGEKDKNKNNTISKDGSSLASVENLYEIMIENPKEENGVFTTEFIFEFDSSVKKLTKENVLEIDKNIKERFPKLYNQFENGISSYECTEVEEIVVNEYLIYIVSGNINEYYFKTIYHASVFDAYGVHMTPAMSVVRRKVRCGYYS